MNSNVPGDPLQQLGIDIAKSFHEQFAQNQNHHQSLFLQVLTVLLTVLVGFGYIYVRVDAGSNEVKVTVETLYAFLALAVYLLSLGVALILNMALGFRRDQMVACNIRVKTGVMDVADPVAGNFFPPSFNPINKTGRAEWMPGFHQVFYIALLIVKVLLLFSVILNSNFKPVADAHHPNWLITFAIVMTVASFALDAGISWCFRRKWIKTAKDGPERLRQVITNARVSSF